MEQMNFFDFFNGSGSADQADPVQEQAPENNPSTGTESADMAAPTDAEVTSGEIEIDDTEESNAVSPAASEEKPSADQDGFTDITEDEGVEFCQTKAEKAPDTETVAEKAKEPVKAAETKAKMPKVPDFLKISETEGKEAAVKAKLDYILSKTKTRNDTVGMWKPLIDHLRNRCREDEGFADDLLQPHKTYDRFMMYMFKRGAELAESNRAVYIGDDSIVFEWAEDYFRKDDKAEIEKLKAAETKSAAKSTKKVEKKSEFQQIDFGSLFNIG